MTDYNQGGRVGLNASGSSGGLIATDYTEATGFLERLLTFSIRKLVWFYS